LGVMDGRTDRGEGRRSRETHAPPTDEKRQAAAPRPRRQGLPSACPARAFPPPPCARNEWLAAKRCQPAGHETQMREDQFGGREATSTAAAPTLVETVGSAPASSSSATASGNLPWSQSRHLSQFRGARFTHRQGCRIASGIVRLLRITTAAEEWSLAWRAQALISGFGVSVSWSEV